MSGTASRPALRSPWLALALVVAVAAALRLPTLGHQSLWFDEAATAIVVKGSFSDMLDRISDLEGSPPFFYLVEWLWTRPFGHSETALRTVSALAGIAVVPVAFLAVRRLAGDVAGLLTALLLATAPFLVWFSQEARNYSLMVLVVALAAAGAVRFDATGDRRAYAGTVVAAAVAIATHYFAAFLVIPLVVWVVRHERRPRGALAALAALPFVTGLALLPLALHQSETARGATVGALGTRLAQLPKQLLVGYHSPGDTVLALVAGALVAAGFAMAARGLAGEARRRVLACLALALCGVVPILALTAAGSDYLNTRNAIAVLVPLAAALGIALAHRRAGLAVAAALALLGTGTTISVAADDASQRDDWRGALRALGPGGVSRAIVAGDQSSLPIRVYRHRAGPGAGPAVTVVEIDVLAIAARGTGSAPQPPAARTLRPPAGFRPAGTRRTEQYLLQRYRAAAPQRVPLAALGALGLGPGATQVYVEP